MTMNRKPRRSVLYVPAANGKAMAKAGGLACDCVIFDLEDAVAPEEKAAAREGLRAHLAGAPASPQERIVRVNGLSTPWGREDLAMAAAIAPDAVLLPKVERPDDLAEARKALDAAGAGRTRLWAMVETPLAIVGIRKIAAAGRYEAIGLDCLVAGTNDLAKETSLPLPEARKTIEHWLTTLVIHARAYGLDALDGVYNDFRDGDGFERECRAGALLGFDGKTLIHPGQIGAANAAFSPSQDAVAKARAIVAAFEDPQNAGKGVLSLGGQMVERLHLDIARRVLAKAGA